MVVGVKFCLKNKLLLVGKKLVFSGLLVKTCQFNYCEKYYIYFYIEPINSIDISIFTTSLINFYYDFKNRNTKYRRFKVLKLNWTDGWNVIT